MPFLLAEILNFQGSTHHIGVGSFSKEFTMVNTEKTAVEIEWILDVPVREDIYEYIVNS